MTRLLNASWARWLMIALILVLGLYITPHYGESWDERQFFKYADHALEAYSTWPRTGTIPLTGNTYDNYGPAFVMLTALLARLFGTILPWITSDLRHLVYFFTFVVGLWAVYRLSRRWMSALAALGVTLLLATQPVIWGHAFISPKDVPFLAFVVLSLLLGLEMVDRSSMKQPKKESATAPRWLQTATIVGMGIVVLLIILTPLVHSAIEQLVTSAAAGESNIVTGLASDIRTADPAIYVGKFFLLFLRLRAAIVVVTAALLAVFWSRIPGSVRLLGMVAPAGVVLGFTTSIRVLGPFVAVFVAAYALRKVGRRAIAMLSVYGLFALAAMYVTWPYLWPDPLGHFVESVRVMAQYPWRGSVLFDGAQYSSTNLPYAYLPVLLCMQLTETAWLSIMVGILIGLVTIVRRRGSYAVLLLGLFWFLVPLAAFVLTRAPLYDNFRQVLFILPPLFMLAGLAFDAIPRRPLQLVLMALAVLPGIIEGVQLHPYEYIYYNRMSGGVHGAFRRFELDYWGTSYREAADYLNAVAPPNSAVWVEGPTHLFQTYSRPDIKVYSTYEAERSSRYDYVVALTRFDLDLQSFPDAPVDHVIQRDGALLTVIKKP